MLHLFGPLRHHHRRFDHCHSLRTATPRDERTNAASNRVAPALHLPSLQCVGTIV